MLVSTTTAQTDTQAMKRIGMFRDASPTGSPDEKRLRQTIADGADDSMMTEQQTSP